MNGRLVFVPKSEKHTGRHYCYLPHDEDYSKTVGSIWQCAECGQFWIVQFRDYWYWSKISNFKVRRIMKKAGVPGW